MSDETQALKPREWLPEDSICTRWRAAALGGHYELVLLDREEGGWSVNFSWGRPLAFWFIQGEPDGTFCTVKPHDDPNARLFISHDRPALLASPIVQEIVREERERCAKIAMNNQHGAAGQPNAYNWGCRDTARAIAARIRKGVE